MDFPGRLRNGEDPVDDATGTEDLAVDFVRINELLRSGAGRAAALRRLVELAVTVVPGCDWAAITAWPPGQRPRSIASSDDVALTADHVQYTLGDGPCLTAAIDEQIVHVADFDDDERWALFRAAARRRTPIRGLLSVRLNEEPDRTALNFYSGRPRAYDRQAIAAAALFAAHARVLLMHADSSEKATQLDHAVISNRQIGIAVGILMQLHKITDDEAFALLRTTSQHLNRKLSLVAEDVTRTGTLPQD